MWGFGAVSRACWVGLLLGVAIRFECCALQREVFTGLLASLSSEDEAVVEGAADCLCAIVGQNKTTWKFPNELSRLKDSRQQE